MDEVDTDNNENYISLLSALIESIDELSSLEITKIPTGINFRIAPSVPLYVTPILENVLNLNNMLGIKLILSKSIKNNSTLNFEISMK